MSISVISFTRNGQLLSEGLYASWKEEPLQLYTKCKLYMESQDNITEVKQQLHEWTGEQMKKGNGLLFIGACGIAVRAIAPYLNDKLQDVPVLVMDELGTYIIPILSGHVGGANELATEIAAVIGATPVITTATDLNGKFAVDLFAKKNQLQILNKDGIAKVSAKVLAGERITMSVETGHGPHNIQQKPEELDLVPYPPSKAVDILITAENPKENAGILLKPRNYVLGVGCKKGKNPDEIAAFISEILLENHIEEWQIFALASIEQKKEEEGFIRWCKNRKRPFITYTAEQLAEVLGDFSESSFVEQTVGISNVCERAAMRACNGMGTMSMKKRAKDGMTIAIAKKEWSVEFDEM